MPYKSEEDRKKAASDHYQKNKAAYQLRDRLRIERNRQWLKEYKQTCCCSECGESRSVCLDFHHVDPSTKTMNVCELVNNRFSIERIQAEIDKCIVLCANCHRASHSGNVWEEDSSKQPTV